MYWNAWCEIRDDRFYGAFGGIGQVSFLAIDAWARRADIAGDDFATFKRLIHEMDAEYVSIFREQNKSEDKDTTPETM